MRVRRAHKYNFGLFRQSQLRVFAQKIAKNEQRRQLVLYFLFFDLCSSL